MVLGEGQHRPGEVTVGPDVAGRAIEKGARGQELSPEELTALFAEQRPEVIEEMRAAADQLRSELAGETVTFVVNRNINVSNVCTVGCAFCGFGSIPAATAQPPPTALYWPGTDSRGKTQ